MRDYKFEILNIFVNRKRFCLQKTHLRYLPECCSIATISEQDELSFVYYTFKILQNVTEMKTFIKNKRQHK